MYARTVRIQLKPNSVAEFTRTLGHTIIPLLRTQPGFQDEIAFVVPGGTEAVSISVWDQKADAEAYARSTSPHVLKAVARQIWCPAHRLHDQRTRCVRASTQQT